MKNRCGFTVMAKLLVLVRPLVGYMVLAVAMGLAGHLCASFLTVFGGYGVISLLGFDISLSLGEIFLCMGAFALFRGVLRYGEQACNHYIAFKLLALIRDKLFGALRGLCPAKLEGRDRGDLIALITSDVELLEVFYAHTISPVLIACLYTAVLCVFIGAQHWALGLLALAAYITVGIVLPMVASRLSGEDGMRFRAKSADLSSFVLDSLRGLGEILQYGQGQQRLEEMNRRTDTLTQDERRLKRIAGQNTAAANTVILVFDVAMLLLSAGLYQKRQLGFDGVLISTLALFSSFGPVLALSALGSTLQNTLAAGNRVLDILEEEPVTQDISGKPAADFSGAAADSVGFSYGGETVLSNVSLNIPEGGVIGITGRSGSGKSTLLRLFMRFWDVQKGSVQISGRDVRQINTADLRNVESFMTQETHLFRDSIRSNLLLAKPDATEVEIQRACKMASVHDFIMTLPQGYDTPVGELGDTLSGGERQRLGLARAFLHDAPFLLLDEPTSNLDSLNEGVILRSLQDGGKGKTVVLVSHRRSTMRIADRIFSAEHGRVS